MSKIHPLTFILVLLSLLTFVIFSILPFNSSLVESIYFNGIYKGLRMVLGATISKLPFATIYPVFFLIMILLVLSMYQLFVKANRPRKTISIVINRILQFSLIVYLMFYWLWGFNYKRPDLLSYLEYPVQIPEDTLFAELSWVTDSLAALRLDLPGDLGEFTYDDKAELAIRFELERVFDAVDIAYKGPVRVRLLYPKGTLLRWSTAGIYLPFVSEGHIDPGLHGITWPFTIAHEMSHGYGITGEDSCNFWAFLACINSDRALHRYSGYFGYWRYLLSNARRSNASRYDEFWANVPSILKQDILDVLSYSNRYPDLLPALRDQIYDSYLKSHGIEDGLKNYSRIIVLVQAWKNTYQDLDLSGIGYSQ